MLTTWTFTSRKGHGEAMCVFCLSFPPPSGNSERDFHSNWILPVKHVRWTVTESHIVGIMGLVESVPFINMDLKNVSYLRRWLSIGANLIEFEVSGNNWAQFDCVWCFFLLLNGIILWIGKVDFNINFEKFQNSL